MNHSEMRRTATNLDGTETRIKDLSREALKKIEDEETNIKNSLFGLGLVVLFSIIAVTAYRYAETSDSLFQVNNQTSVIEYQNKIRELENFKSKVLINSNAVISSAIKQLDSCGKFPDCRENVSNRLAELREKIVAE